MTVETVVLVLLGAAAMLARVGQAWYMAGLSRSKNGAGAVLRNVLDVSVTALAFWAIGAAILHYPGPHRLGLTPGLIFDANSTFGAVTFFYLVLMTMATAPVAAAAAERCKLLPLGAVSILFAAVVIPITGQWCWNLGWLRRLGFIDVGGAAVLHLSGGCAAAMAAILVGPRTGKYNRDGSSNFIPGHSMPLASLGVMMILAGWLACLSGAAMLHGGSMQRAPIHAILAAAAGTIVALCISRVRYGKADVLLTYSGTLGALVAISAGGGAVSSIAAVVIGAIAGWLVPTATVRIDTAWKIDDPGGLVAVNIVGGIWGTIAVPLFLPGPLMQRLTGLSIQLLGVAVIAAITLAASACLLLILRGTLGLRLREADEFDGVDLAENDLNAYPDFQQTTIKSYHLREA